MKFVLQKVSSLRFLLFYYWILAYRSKNSVWLRSQPSIWLRSFVMPVDAQVSYLLGSYKPVSLMSSVFRLGHMGHRPRIRVVEVDLRSGSVASDEVIGSKTLRVLDFLSSSGELGLPVFIQHCFFSLRIFNSHDAIAPTVWNLPVSLVNKHALLFDHWVLLELSLDLKALFPSFLRDLEEHFWVLLM